MHKIIEELEKFIREKNIEAEHMLRTGFWLKRIFSEADDVFFVAAICHDIERCFPLREGEVKPSKTGDDSKDEEYLWWHGKRSAEFAEKLLREYGFDDEEKLAKIKTLITEHSFGGSFEKDLMRDADSLSLLENNIPLFIKEKKDQEKLKEKIVSEFARLSCEKSRELAKPFFDKALNDLGLKI